MSATKIHRLHHERLAYVYVRQSTPGQVQHHQESAVRQYQLHDRAIALGWPPSAVQIIDEDQGRSGRATAHRPGFQRLVSQVSLGKVGLVLMLEASRLARNNSDWHHLIEICGLRGTLIADEDAIYDPREPNDRLLLGLKGALSEAELFTLRTRLYEGRWAKARKGELAFLLPAGYVRGPEGRWEKEPDVQVRERLDYVFTAFRRHGVARAVVRDLQAHHLELPTRVVTKDGYGTLAWTVPTLSGVIRVLTNPAYAGAYAYGRWDYTGECRSSTTGKVLARRRLRPDWAVCLPDHHPAYLPWDEFVQNQERLRDNWQHDGRPGVARPGAALLQGIVRCGRCGRTMGVQHHAARERRAPTYLCAQGYRDGAEQICQSMTARPVDAAVAAAFLEAVAPLSVELSVRVVDRIEHDLAAQRRQWELQLTQARYEVRLAQRQFDAVDPDNRLVATELERRWNEKLERVARLEQAYAQAVHEEHWTLTAEERATIGTLSGDLPALWAAASTTNRERKQLLRFAIAAVQLDGVSDPGQIEVQIHWRSGTITGVRVARPARGEGSLKTPAKALGLVRALAATHTYTQIAHHLAAAGWRTAFGRSFSAQHVGYLCRRHGLGRGRRRATPRGPAPRCSGFGEALRQVTPLSGDRGVTGPAEGAGQAAPYVCAMENE